jgi:hypothetical protein
MQGWKPYGFNGSTIDARLVQPSKKVKLLNSAQQNALELTINATPANAVRLENEGFWGINAVQGRTYRLSFWAKGKYKGNIKAVLKAHEAPPTAPEGASILAEAIVSPSGD